MSHPAGPGEPSPRANKPRVRGSPRRDSRGLGISNSSAARGGSRSEAHGDHRRERRKLHPEIDFEEEEKKLHITYPFFAFT